MSFGHCFMCLILLKKEQGELGFYVSYRLCLPLPDSDTLRDYTQKISGVREGE